MKFIKRIPITDAMVYDLQAQQSDLWYTNESGSLVAVSAWVSGQNVSTGDRRSHDGKVWQSLSTHAQTSEPDISPTFWTFVAPTNKWAAFDDAVGSSSKETGTLTFTLDPGKSFDSFACLNMVGNQITAKVEVPGSQNLQPFQTVNLPGGYNWKSITFGNGLFVAIANNSNIAATSPDGITWTQRTLPVSAFWQAITYGNGLFVAVASDTNIAVSSPDGITWTQRTLPVYWGWRAITYGNGLFVVIAYNSNIAATSPDGITWTQRTLPVSASWQAITYGNGLFVAVASDTNIAATSPDGINWTQRTLPATKDWESIAYGNGLFVATASYTNFFLTSPDGINWTQRFFSSNGILWYSITYGNGLFVAIANQSSVAVTSPDGITWTQRTLPATLYWQDIIFGNGLFVAIAFFSSTAARALFAATIYEEATSLIEPEEPIIDWWTYFFAGFRQKESLIVTGLNSSSYKNATLSISISGENASSPVALGTFNFGVAQVLGETEMGLRAGITNYSVYDEDQFGTVRVTPRSFAKRISGSVAVERENYNSVYKALVEYKDIPVVVFPTELADYSESITYGHIRQWELAIDYPTYSLMPIEVRGLI